MAVQVKTLDVRTSPQRRQVIQDLNPGVAKQRTKLPGLLDILLGTLPPGVLPQGTARLLVGTSPRNEARENFESRRLEAKIRRDETFAERTEAEAAAIRAGPSPIDEETRQFKLTTLRRFLPLEFATREISLEAEEAELAREAIFFPLLEDEKRAQISNFEALADRRQAETARILGLIEVAAEKTAAEASLLEAKSAQTVQNLELIDTALGGLDGFSKGIFLRDRLFPKPPEARRGTVPRGVRTITSF